MLSLSGRAELPEARAHQTLAVRGFVGREHQRPVIQELASRHPSAAKAAHERQPRRDGTTALAPSRPWFRHDVLDLPRTSLSLDTEAWPCCHMSGCRRRA